MLNQHHNSSVAAKTVPEKKKCTKRHGKEQSESSNSKQNMKSEYIVRSKRCCWFFPNLFLV